MLVRDKYLRDLVFDCNLEVGKIVQAYQADKERKEIRDIFPLSKTSQMEPQELFIAATRNGFSKMDPRQSGCKAVNGEARNWTTVDLSCGATTANGEIATGSNTGEVRLYKNLILKAAKTLLPKGRDPHLDIDVTNRGTYVVATCDRYLILYDTQTKSGDLGFHKSFPKNEKPNGIRIQLTQEHEAHIASEKIPFRFKGAKYVLHFSKKPYLQTHCCSC